MVNDPPPPPPYFCLQAHDRRFGLGDLKDIDRSLGHTLEPPDGRVAAESPRAPPTRSSISRPKNDFEGIRSLNPTKLLRFSPPKNVLVKLLH